MTEARRRVAAVIVNYNAGTSLDAAVHSLRDDTSVEWDVVVVDNASVDGSQTRLGSTAPWVRVLQNSTNVGFGRGVNQGVDATTADYVLLINPDCTLQAGAVAVLSEVLDAHPDCAIVGPRILDPNGEVQGSARGDPDMLTGLFGRTSLLQRLLPGSRAARRNVQTSQPADAGRQGRPVDWLSGACMLVRRSAFVQVGGFDPRYFLYWEDADLCRRLRQVGFHVRYVPAAEAVHQVGQSSRTAKAASIRAFHQSAYLYYATHVAPVPLDPRRLLARALLAVRCWLRLRTAR